MIRGLQPPSWPKHFCGNHYFLGSSQQPKKLKKIVFMKQKIEVIPFSEMKCPKSQFLLIIVWGKSVEAILNNVI